MSSDPTLDGHDADVSARIVQTYGLLRVRDGLDRICELINSEAEEFLGHISNFDVWCGLGRGGVAVLLPGFK